jgi:O-antigen/teichoic acid export membrane protein
LILAILAAGRVVAVTCGSSAVTLMMTGHQRALMNLTIVTGIASILGGMLMAPRFGGIGVAISTASVAVAQNILLYLLAKRYTGIKTMAELSLRPFLQFLFGRGLQA